MPCGEKIHTVREKRKRQQQRQEEAERKRREEAERGIPVEGWPIKLPAPRPAETPA